MSAGICAPFDGRSGAIPDSSSRGDASARSGRSSSDAAACEVSSASTVAVRSPDRETSDRAAGATSATPGTPAIRSVRPGPGVPEACIRIGAPARKSAWSSCERDHEAPCPIAIVPSATASTSSSTGPAPRIGRRLSCQPASAAASPRPLAARRSASRATSGSSRSASTVPASSASVGVATNSGSIPRAPASSASPVPEAEVCWSSCQ
ncbi:hypothetical protein [Streptomyces collinus]